MNLTLFLLSRIAEDRQVAEYALSRGDGGEPDYAGQWFGASSHAQRWTPTRALAECDAKAALIRFHAGRTAVRAASDPPPFEPDRCSACMTHEWPCPTLRVIASVYADHPEFRDEWLSA